MILVQCGLIIRPRILVATARHASSSCVKNLVRLPVKSPVGSLMSSDELSRLTNLEMGSTSSAAALMSFPTASALRRISSSTACHASRIFSKNVGSSCSHLPFSGSLKSRLTPSRPRSPSTSSDRIAAALIASARSSSINSCILSLSLIVASPSRFTKTPISESQSSPPVSRVSLTCKSPASFLTFSARGTAVAISPCNPASASLTMVISE